MVAPSTPADRASSSIVVVGAGIFGLTAASELRSRGWQVVVIDAGPVPCPTAASTDISKIVRMDYGADVLYTAMSEAALAGWDRWNARWETPLYHQDGFLLLSPCDMQPGGFEHDSFMLLRQRGHRVVHPGRTDRLTRFPAWPIEKYPDGYFNPRAGWVESGRVVAALAAEARASGVILMESMRCARLLEQRRRVAGVRTLDGSELHADAVLVAAGAWTPALLPHLADLMWTTGQPVAHCKVKNPAEWQAPHFPVWAADISHAGWYGFPALSDGTLKIARHGPGRRVQPDGPRTVTPDEESQLREFLRDSLPALGDAPILTMRLCLYCDAFDGNFWIDHDPERPGLIVAAGDSGHGFKFAPVLGGLIADVVERKPNDWAPRFRWRARGPDAREAARAV